MIDLFDVRMRKRVWLKGALSFRCNYDDKYCQVSELQEFAWALIWILIPRFLLWFAYLASALQLRLVTAFLRGWRSKVWLLNLNWSIFLFDRGNCELKLWLASVSHSIWVLVDCHSEVVEVAPIDAFDRVGELKREHKQDCINHCQHSLSCEDPMLNLKWMLNVVVVNTIQSEWHS